MKNVRKSPEPEELKNYKKRYSSQFKRYADLKKNRAFEKVRTTLASDQKGLCAYCEMELHEKDRSVEHFIPRHQSTKENNHDLDWLNMMAICKGGLQNVEIPGENDSIRNSRPPHNFPCCGAAKYEFIPDGRLLNPLNLPTLRLFKFSSLTGEMMPDEIACLKAGIPIENVQFTIDKLGLNVQRLKGLRLAVIKDIEEQLKDETTDPNDLEEKIAAEELGYGTGNWPRFFTTIRWFLGAGAERHLTNISYLG